MSSIVKSSPLPGLFGRGLLQGCGATALYRLPVYALCTLTALMITGALGKDLTWDTYTYHLYAGFSALHDRLRQDYFAAGPQSYFNPYAYVPFYLLVRSGIPSYAIGFILVVWHSAILWLTYELAVAVCPSAEPRTRAGLGLCAVLLALLNPLLLQQFGSSFADITTAELVLGGWLLLTRCVRAPRATLVVAAGVLLGAAAALKLTNAVYAIAGAALLLWLAAPGRTRIRFGARYGTALALGFAVVAAPWCYQLGVRFGNPFFPLLNNIFHSPEFTTEPLRLVRFIPANLGEALGRPFDMLDPAAMVHDELPAPDSRYAVLLLLGCALLLKRLLSWLRARRRPVDEEPTRNAELPTDTRTVAALASGFVVAWALWLAGSGNSRYFLPMACVSAALIATLLPLLLGARLRNTLTAVFAVLALQLSQMYMSPGVRWSALPWDSAPWIRADVPPKLTREPALYLSMGALSNSFLAAYVAPGSGFINFTGAYALGLDGASGERVAALIARYGSHLRFLSAGSQLYTDSKHLPNVADVDGAVARFGLRSDPRDCALITLTLSESHAGKPPFTGDLISCALVPDASYQAELLPHQKTAELILDRVEDACPALFQPRRPLIEYRNHRWLRVYLNTDVFAWVSRGWVKVYNPVSGDGPMFVGRDVDWEKAPQQVACGRRGGHDFIRIVGPGPGAR
jgi:hypothetical protein